MPVKKLEKALQAIESAKDNIKRVKNNIPDNNDIRRAERELEDAGSLVIKAIRDVKYN
jgi:hypothetical protein